MTAADVERTSYLGCTVAVYSNGIVVTTTNGDVEGFTSMAAARLWIRRRRRERVAA